MRPTLDQYLMELAKIAATRTTCIRRGVGCVLANKRGHVLSIGYNGVARGLPHCNERDEHHAWGNLCEGHDLPPGKDQCQAIHAEQNALIQCRDVWEIETAYVTLSPCKACLKLLLNTNCQRIVFLQEHTDPMPKALWLSAGRQWERLLTT